MNFVKILSNQEKKKIRKFIPLGRYLRLEQSLGGADIKYCQQVKYWYQWLSSEFDYKMDFYCLAVILHEVNLVHGGFDFKRSLLSNNGDLFMGGAKNLLDTINKYELNEFNITSLKITSRYKDYNSNNLPGDDLIKILKTPSRPVYHEIKGYEVISAIFKLLSEHKEQFATMANTDIAKQKAFKEGQHNKTGLIKIRKATANVLDRYIRNELPSMNNNKVYYMGGLILFTLELLPPYTRESRHKTHFNNFLTSNFREAIKS